MHCQFIFCCILSYLLFIRFAEWYGTYKEGDSAACATNFKTLLSNKPEQWRNVAYDTANKVFYVCDITVKREVKGPKMVCLSSPDGDTWNGKSNTTPGNVVLR